LVFKHGHIPGSPENTIWNAWGGGSSQSSEMNLHEITFLGRIPGNAANKAQHMYKDTVV